MEEIQNKDIFGILKQSFDDKRSRNPAFSLRAFANQLDISAATLSRIFNGERKISKKSAKKILSRVIADNPDRYSYLADEIDIKTEFTELDQFQLEIFSEWYYFAILSLAEIKGVNLNSELISERLNISKQKAENALKKLIQIGLLKRAKNKIIITEKQLSTSDRVLNLSVRKMNRDSLTLATNYLDNIHDKVSLEKSDYSGVTMAIDPSKLHEANKRIKRFRRSLCKFLEDGEQKQVYRLGIQLFPLSE